MVTVRLVRRRLPAAVKSGVEIDWEDSTPPPPITILYNETVSNISPSRHPLRHGYTTGKRLFLCLEYAPTAFSYKLALAK